MHIILRKLLHTVNDNINHILRKLPITKRSETFSLRTKFSKERFYLFKISLYLTYKKLPAIFIFLALKIFWGYYDIIVIFYLAEILINPHMVITFYYAKVNWGQI